MKPTTFEAQNIVLGKGQPQYLELPALRCDDPQGTVWSCWELDDADIQDLIRHRKVWIGQLTFRHPFSPQMVTTVMPAEVSVATYKLRLTAKEGETAQPPTSTAPALNWYEMHDDDDNPFWEADGPYCDVDGGTEFSWRLKPVPTRESFWMEAHDPELMGERVGVWCSLEDAKAAIKAKHLEIIAAAKGGEVQP